VRNGARCTSNLNTAWMLQQARNLLMCLDDRDRQVWFLLHDRDAKFPRRLRRPR
jgi:putative transposase